MSPPEQRRILKTAIPGPTSPKPQEQRTARLTGGLGVTSVGAVALDRFVRPVTSQAVPESCLLPEAWSGNPGSVPRRVNGVLEPVVSRS